MRDQFDSQDLIVKEAFSSIQQEVPNLLPGVLEGIKQKPRRNRKKIALILCAVLLFTSLSAFALERAGFFTLFEQVEDEFSSFYQPVGEFDIYDGIRMEVAALLCYENQIMAYITLEDLQGDRLQHGVTLRNETINFKLDPVVGGMHSFEQVYVDEETDIVTLLVRFQGDKLPEILQASFIIEWLYPNLLALSQQDTGINLALADLQPELIWTADPDFSGRFMEQHSAYMYERLRDGTVLKSQGRLFEFTGIETHYVSAMGFIDDKLHIQTYEAPGVISDFELKIYDENGTEIPLETLYYADVGESKIMSRLFPDMLPYRERVYDISSVDLETCQVLIDYTMAEHMEGRWSVTVPVEISEPEVRSAACQLNFGDVEADRVEVTPFGVVLCKDAPRETLQFDTPIYDLAVQVEMGTASLPAVFHQATTDDEKGEQQEILYASGELMGSIDLPEKDLADLTTKIMYATAVPLDLNEVTAVIIEGQRIEFPVHD